MTTPQPPDEAAEPVPATDPIAVGAVDRSDDVLGDPRPDQAGATSRQLLPDELTGTSARRLVKRARWRLFLALAVANLIGVLVVVACIWWVLPGAEVAHPARVIVLNSALGAVYLALVVPVGVLWGEAWLRSGRRWLQEGRPPTEKEVTAVLRAPLRLFFVHATLWLVGAVVFSTLDGIIAVNLLPRVAFTVTFAGLTVSAFVYLLAERILRPISAAALSIRMAKRPRLPGITIRTLAAWSLGTGIPVAGLVVVAIFTLVEPHGTRQRLAMTMLVLAGTALLVGSWVTILGARAIAEPIAGIRKGIRRIADGDLDARVRVDDGSVIGLLQAGFNDMAEGLQERERLRDLYGRQVGEDVARDVLERGSQLGGQVCEAAVLFVDVVGSTEIASQRPPEEVVALLNRFFGVVVDEVLANRGWVNKFQGDATLAVFGAPVEVESSAACALAAARAIARRIPEEVPELRAGVGVAFGEVVAGNVGDERRFEFTVIGDPVNEASRLTELAKTRDPMVLASVEAVDAAGPPESACWAEVGSAELRGRSRPTRLAAPTTLDPPIDATTPPIP